MDAKKINRDLLNACKLALKELIHLGAEETDPFSKVKRKSPACDAIRKAIKKAEGA